MKNNQEIVSKTALSKFFSKPPLQVRECLLNLQGNQMSKLDIADIIAEKKGDLLIPEKKSSSKLYILRNHVP